MSKDRILEDVQRAFDAHQVIDLLAADDPVGAVRIIAQNCGRDGQFALDIAAAAVRRVAGRVAGSLDEVEARLIEEITEEQANEEGLFDCPMCGRLRDASEMTPEAAEEWAASRGVKILPG